MYTFEHLELKKELGMARSRLQILHKSALLLARRTFSRFSTRASPHHVSPTTPQFHKLELASDRPGQNRPALMARSSMRSPCTVQLKRSALGGTERP
jgi:hypothetical protein